MHLDDLGSTGDPFCLGERHGVDGVARRAAQLQGDVARQLGGDRCRVAGAVSCSMVDSVAVDHRADRIASTEIVEREVDHGAALRTLNGVAEAVRQPRPDQLFDDVQLECRPPDVCTEMTGLRR